MAVENRRPVRRALRWDGLFTIGLPGPEALAELAAEIRDARPRGAPFDLVTELPADADLGPWERAGLTWAVTDFGIQPTEAGVRAVIEAGPGWCPSAMLAGGPYNPRGKGETDGRDA